jgi:TIR domain
LSAIFISYRREDSEDSARALYESLLPLFGKERVFMDVEAGGLGCDYRQTIESSLSTCGVFLAMIGPAWLNITAHNDPSGRRRLDNPNDTVRQEIATALKKGGSLPVIPVLIRDASMPTSDELPDDLKDLSYRIGLALNHLDWEDNVKKLVAAITPRVGGLETQASPGGTGLGQQDAAAVASRDFFLGRWRVDQVFGSLSGNTLVDYFSNGRFEGVDMEVSGNQGERVDESGTWEFEGLSTQLFRVKLSFDNGVQWAGKFRIIDRNHIHNIDMNYVAERVD